MMNAAMDRLGHEQRFDARSWVERGRPDLAELVEPRLLTGSGTEARALHAHVDGLREQRAELPAPRLRPEQGDRALGKGTKQQIAQVQKRAAQELSRLDELIAIAGEFAHEVKDRTVTFAKDIKERDGSLFGNAPQEEQAKASREKDQAQEQARPPTRRCRRGWTGY